MEREAKAIAALKFEFDCILTSPLLRAKQTAEILADRLGVRDIVIEDRRLGIGFSLEHLAAILVERAEARSVVLVGHEPSMSTTIGMAIGRANVEMKKAALAGVEFAGASPAAGTLFCLIPPKVLTTFG